MRLAFFSLGYPFSRGALFIGVYQQCLEATPDGGASKMDGRRGFSGPAFLICDDYYLRRHGGFLILIRFYTKKVIEKQLLVTALGRNCSYFQVDMPSRVSEGYGNASFSIPRGIFQRLWRICYGAGRANAAFILLPNYNVTFDPLAKSPCTVHMSGACSKRAAC
jgi:hypothetical protein